MKMELPHHRQSSGAPDPQNTDEPQARVFDNIADLSSTCPAVCDPRLTLLWSSAHTQGSFSSLFQKLDGGRELSEVRDGFSIHISGTHPRLDLELQLPQILQTKPV